MYIIYKKCQLYFYICINQIFVCRFGQTSPKPTDKLPPLDFENENPNESESVTLREKIREKTPVPPL